MTKLEYRIHWVDDTPDWVESVKEPIEREFGASDIDLDIVTVDRGDDIEDRLRAQSTDLVILDYNLPGKTGVELVKELRARGNLVEIIFYTQDDQRKTDFKSWEGVHSCHREEAQEKLSEVINRFIDRTKNLAIMRGMIISEAIDCENHLTEIILRLFGEKSSLFQEKVLNKAYLDFEKKRMLVTSVLKDRKASAGDSGASTEIEGCLEVLRDMKKEIVDQRNILAHSEKTVTDDGVLILKGLNKSQGDIEFNNAWKNDIRLNIKKHIVNLHEIRRILSE